MQSTAYKVLTTVAFVAMLAVFYPLVAWMGLHAKLLWWGYAVFLFLPLLRCLLA